MKEKALPGSKKREISPVSELEVVVPALRCPYCHDACAPNDSVVCRDCLARHHSECWSENGACSACQSTVKLVAEERPVLGREEALRLLRQGKSDEVERRFIEAGLSPEDALREAADIAFRELTSLGPWKAAALRMGLFGSQAVLLAGLGVFVANNDAKTPVWTAAAVLGVISILAALGKLARKLPKSLLVKQLGLALFGVLSAMALIISLDISPLRPSMSLCILAFIVAAMSAVIALRKP